MAAFVRLPADPGQASTPSVILLMADDLGWGDTGYNGNPVIKTPRGDFRLHADHSDAVGVELPQGANTLDGVRMLPLLRDQEWSRPAPIAFASKGQFTYNGPQYKLVGPDQLYDLTNDPHEKQNVADPHPQVVRDYREAQANWYVSCRNSFEGDEYGTTSRERLEQEFPELREQVETANQQRTDR